MRFELAMIVVVESLDGRLLDRAVHSLDLPIGPGTLHFSQAVLDAVVGQNGMDPIGHCLNDGREEGGRRGSPGLSDDLHEGEFARAINGLARTPRSVGAPRSSLRRPSHPAGLWHSAKRKAPRRRPTPSSVRTNPTPETNSELDNSWGQRQPRCNLSHPQNKNVTLSSGDNLAIVFSILQY